MSGVRSEKGNSFMLNRGEGFKLRSVLQARGQGSRLRSAAPYFIKAYLLAAFLTLVGKCAAFLPPTAMRSSSSAFRTIKRRR